MPEKLFIISYVEHKANGWMRREINFLWAHGNFFWQLSRDRNWHGSRITRAMTAPPKPSFRAPSRVGDVVVGRGNSGWTTSKSCQNCSKWPPAEKTGKGSLLDHPSCPPPSSPDNLVGQGLNWTEQKKGTLLPRVNLLVTDSVYTPCARPAASVVNSGHRQCLSLQRKLGVTKTSRPNQLTDYEMHGQWAPNTVEAGHNKTGYNEASDIAMQIFGPGQNPSLCH